MWPDGWSKLPHCNRIVEALAKFCPACGINVPLGRRRNELTALTNENTVALKTVQAENPHKGRDYKIASLCAGTVGGDVGLLMIVCVVAFGMGLDRSNVTSATTGSFCPTELYG